jgi:hypothetical protein
MKHLRHIFFLAVLLQFSSFANASMIYATDIDWANNGTIGGNNDRNNPNNALGEADGAFTAIGLGGFSVFSFGEEFQSSASIWEVTFGCGFDCGHHPEQAQVWVGNDYLFGSHDLNDVLDDFSQVGTINNTEARNGGSLSFSGTWTYLALIDTSFELGARSADGFDVDAVSVHQAPEPSSLALILLGVAGLLAKRRAAN